VACDNQGQPQDTETSTLSLLTVSPGGSSSTQVIHSESANTSSNPLPIAAIPDGQGGVLATWIDGGLASLPFETSHVTSQGITTYTLPLNGNIDPKSSVLVLGESGTAFATDGASFSPGVAPTIVSFDINSGSVHWSYQAATGGTLSIIASISGNGLVGKLTDQNGTDRVFSFDSNGSPADEGISGSLIGAGWQAQLFTAVGEFAYSTVNFANSSWPSPGANPGGTATSILNIGTYESAPLFALPFQPKGVLKCPAGDSTTPQVPIGGGVATKYNLLVEQQYKQTVQDLLGGDTLTSQTGTCGQFFSANSQLAPYFSQLKPAVFQQVAYDGLQSTISMYNAGLWTQEQIDDTETRFQLLNTPVCWTFSKLAKGTGDWNGTVAQAQIQPPATNIYLYTGKEAVKNLTQSTVLHESLHNLTKLNDEQLYKLLTGKDLGLQPSVVINTVLVQNGCAAQ
jgi:hypothetical protein